MLILLCCIALVVAGILSKELPAGLAKKVSGILAIALLVPVVLIVAAGLAFEIFLWSTKPPELKHLARTFPRQRKDLETLVFMSGQDHNLSRIDPDFVDKAVGYGSSQGPYTQDSPDFPLPKERWNQYRNLFRRDHLSQGIERDPVGDIFFRFGAQGFLDRGYATGIVFCQSPSANKDLLVRYEPCRTNDVVGSGPEVDNPHHEAYEFNQLEPHWYAYEQGPG